MNALVPTPAKKQLMEKTFMSCFNKYLDTLENPDTEVPESLMFQLWQVTIAND